MKKIRELKLNQLCESALKKTEMNFLNGGSTCTCSCYGGLSFGMQELMGEQTEKCQGECVCVCTCDPLEIGVTINENYSYPGHLDIKIQS
jgi:natural product precursor